MDGLECLIQCYISCIHSGLMKVEEIPERYRDLVIKKLNETSVG